MRRYQKNNWRENQRAHPKADGPTVPACIDIFWGRFFHGSQNHRIVADSIFAVSLPEKRHQQAQKDHQKCAERQITAECCGDVQIQQPNPHTGK